MGGATEGVRGRRAAACGIAVVLGTSTAALAVAYPQSAPAATVARALADGAATVTLGLAAVPMMDTGRYRDELAGRAGAPLAWSAGLWLFAELCRLVVGAADAAAVPVTRVGLTTTIEFTRATADGRSGAVSVVVAGLILLLAAIASRTPPAGIAAAGLATVGLVARTIGGHVSASSLGAVAIALHATAAALWCGTLAALVLTVDHRGQWSRVLPRFSRLALWCVIALLVGGLVGAFVVVDSPAQLFATGYGRVLLIKIVLTFVLMVVAWRNRGRWLPAATAHRVTAYASRARSLTELAIMTVALTMAAALSVTG